MKQSNSGFCGDKSISSCFCSWKSVSNTTMLLVCGLRSAYKEQNCDKNGNEHSRERNASGRTTERKTNPPRISLDQLENQDASSLVFAWFRTVRPESLFSHWARSHFSGNPVNAQTGIQGYRDGSGSGDALSRSLRGRSGVSRTTGTKGIFIERLHRRGRTNGRLVCPPSQMSSVSRPLHHQI